MNEMYDPLAIPEPPPDAFFPDLRRVLDEATSADGGRRFYPLAAHPAGFRERWVVDRLRRIAAIREREDPEMAEAIAYHVRKIVEVEAGELERKAEYLRSWASAYDGR